MSSPPTSLGESAGRHAGGRCRRGGVSGSRLCGETGCGVCTDVMVWVAWLDQACLPRRYTAGV